MADLQERFRAHIQASEHCQRHAANAIAQREAGRPDLAQASERKARYWMRRMMKIEGRIR